MTRVCLQATRRLERITINRWWSEISRRLQQSPPPDLTEHRSRLGVVRQRETQQRSPAPNPDDEAPRSLEQCTIRGRSRPQNPRSEEPPTPLPSTPCSRGDPFPGCVRSSCPSTR